jgi:hypothetical protein
MAVPLWAAGACESLWFHPLGVDSMFKYDTCWSPWSQCSTNTKDMMQQGAEVLKSS